MLDLRFTNQFKKDYKLAQKRGYDLSEFEAIVNKLRNREELDPKYKDHQLSNNWKNHRDFHLHPDLVGYLLLFPRRRESPLELKKEFHTEPLF